MKKRFYSSVFLLSFAHSRILDSMKVPGQRSSFHICDILDLNTTASDTKNNTQHNSNNSSNNVITSDTSFPTQTSNATSSRDDSSILSSTITSIPSTQLPPPPPPLPPPYQIASSLNSSMYAELGHHYQSILPSVTRSWLKETENYGKCSSWVSVSYFI